MFSKEVYQKGFDNPSIISNWPLGVALILYLITPLQTFIYFILLMFITQSQRVRQWLKPAEKVGKTAFTNFILQILLLTLIIRIFFDSSCPTPSQSILISVITILIMSVLTKV